MSSDPWTGYFTKARLKRLRELHTKYPLWCGDWPDAAELIPESQFSLTDFRIDRALWEMCEEAANPPWTKAGWTFPSAHDVLAILDPDVPSTGDVPVYQLLDTDTGTFPTIPVVYNTLLGAVGYLHSAWWRKNDLKAPCEDQWPDVLALIMREQRIDAPKFGVSGFELWQLYREVVAANELGIDRKGALQNLRSYWLKIGKQAGIIPNFQGAPKHSIPAQLLQRLVDEAGRLVMHVAEYDPTDDECDVSRLLESDPYKLELVDLERELDAWCLRLAFPMLTFSEVKEATPMLTPGRKLTAHQLVEVRFRIDPEFASQKISRGRPKNR